LPDRGISPKTAGVAVGIYASSQAVRGKCVPGDRLTRPLMTERILIRDKKAGPIFAKAESGVKKVIAETGNSKPEIS
jgi:hypothetical protein